MAKDAGSKQDQPKADVEPDAKVEQDAKDTVDAANTEQSQLVESTADPDVVEAASPGTPQAEGTAAAETGVDKAAAEAALEGAEAKPKRARKPRAKKADAEKADEAEEKPKPARRSRAKKAEEPVAETSTDEAKAEEKPKPARRSRAKTEEKPAPAPAREERELVTVRAQAKFVRTSARKARLIADHVRGKDVQQARAILAFSPRAVAEDWRKVLESAIANAEHNHDLVGDDLRILNATADEGPTLKRYRPRAMGRATRIRKRTSHLTITLTPKD